MIKKLSYRIERIQNQSVKYIQSDFNLFPTTVLSTGNWTSLYTFTMSTKPVAIDIFVQHLGVIIDKHTSSLLFFNYLTLVNYNIFLLSVNHTFQSSFYRLHMSLSIQCINGMMGDSCELICENLSSKSQLTFVSCKSSITNEHFNCTYNAYNSQVTGCTLCTADGSNGTCTVQSIIEYNTPTQRCRATDDPPQMRTLNEVIKKQIYSVVLKGVSAAFRVWTIVLGCLLGIAVLFILCLIISYIIIKNRENDDNAPIFKSTQYGKGKSGNPPLLDDEWNTAPRRTVTVEPDRCPTRLAVTPKSGLIGKTLS
uniref:Transmembrane protein n=1 Tax=Heterorhabditis bacteriophora TaxID=37862 RepID=A0A1I7WLR7_HETBA